MAVVLTNTEMWKVAKCHTFGRLGISCFEKAKLLKVGKVFSTFLLPPELIWGSPMPGVWDIINLSWGPIRWTNYNFHPHVQYCITIQYLSCSIDKYRNVKDVKCHNFERLGISHLEKERFCKSHPKGWESFLHIPSPTWADLRFPHARGLRYHQPFMRTYQMDKL